MSKSRKKSHRVGLSLRTINAMPKPKTGRVVIHDSQCRGLGVARYPSGNFMYFWFRKVNFRPRWISVGEFPGLSVEQARQIAEGHNKTLAAWKAAGFSGRDPFLRGISTLAEVFDSYSEVRLAKAKHPDEARAAREYQFERYFDAWKDRKIASIGSEEIEALHIELTEENGPVAANRAAQFLRALFAFAKKKKLISGDNPVEVEMNPEEPRARRVSKQEFVKLWKAIDSEKLDPDIGDYVRLSLVTGARKMDLLRMHRRDIDESCWVWKIPGSETKVKSYRVPLIPIATEIIERRTKDGYVFPGKLPGSHRSSIRSSWERLLTKTGITGLTCHDLRRSLASILADSGVSPILIMHTLGHSELGTTSKVYALPDVNPIRTVIAAAYQTMTGNPLPEKDE
jgi:integrase